MKEADPFWYLASYPKSGNTWCRVFIAELLRLAGSDQPFSGATVEIRGLSLNRDLATGSIVSSRRWLDDQLGIDSSDLCWSELDQLRGRIGCQKSLYDNNLRYHKVHDAFTSPDSSGHPVVPVVGCRGAAIIIRNPADVAVSLSHFFSWDIERSVAFLIDDRAALCHSSKRGGDQVRQFLGSWADHVLSWIDQDLIPTLIIRFEDLLAQPTDEFARLVRFLDLPADQKLIAQVVANTSFAALRAKEEEEGGFQERVEGCRRFFRGGRSGEGKEFLTEDQLARLRQRFSASLLRFGYKL